MADFEGDPPLLQRRPGGQKAVKLGHSIGLAPVGVRKVGKQALGLQTGQAAQPGRSRPPSPPPGPPPTESPAGSCRCPASHGPAGVRPALWAAADSLRPVSRSSTIWVTSSSSSRGISSSGVSPKQRMGSLTPLCRSSSASLTQAPPAYPLPGAPGYDRSQRPHVHRRWPCRGPETGIPGAAWPAGSGNCAPGRSDRSPPMFSSLWYP